MAIMPRAFVNEAKIQADVERAAALAPDVVRIRYNIGEDWSGTPCLFFRIVITDQASRKKRLGDVVRHVGETVLNEVDPLEMGLQPTHAQSGNCQPPACRRQYLH